VARRREEIPLELVGIDVPYTVEQRDVLDRALGLPAAPPTPRPVPPVPRKANVPVRDLTRVTAEAPHGAA